MAPFMDPEMNHLMTQYYDNVSDPKFLYCGNQENIVKELHAWVVCRQKTFQEQQELREKGVDAALEMKAATTMAQRLEAITEGKCSLESLEVLDKEIADDTSRALYLLNTLKHRDILWPKLWWRPECDGGVCSFLGTVDPTFDPDIILLTLQQAASDEHFKVKMAEYNASESVIELSHDKREVLHGPSTRVEKNAKDESMPAKDKTTKTSVITALNTHPLKWNKIVRTVASGNFPGFKIEKAKLVDVSTDSEDPELRLKGLMEEVLKDLEDEWVMVTPGSTESSKRNH